MLRWGYDTDASHPLDDMRIRLGSLPASPPDIFPWRTPVPPTAQPYLELLKLSVSGVLSAEQEDIEARSTGYGNVDGQTSQFKGSFTQIGLLRLNDIHDAIATVVAQNIPGDFVEAGVWKGGACAFARGVFKELGVTDRSVYLLDTFMGLPLASTDEDQDFWFRLQDHHFSVDSIKKSFKKYGLLDSQVPAMFQLSCFST